MLSTITFNNLPALTLAVNTGLLVLIWMVQVITYPALQHIAQGSLHAWHKRYTARISYCVIPLMFAQAGLYAHAAYAQYQAGGFTALSAVALLLLLTVWVCTFILSVPLHMQLSTASKEAGQNWDTKTTQQINAYIEGLIITNWPRTVAWTGVWALSILELL